MSADDQVDTLMGRPARRSKAGSDRCLDRLAYYQVLGRSWDTTLFADLYTKDYLAAGQEVRYHPTEGTHPSLSSPGCDAARARNRFVSSGVRLGASLWYAT